MLKPSRNPSIIIAICGLFACLSILSFAKTADAKNDEFCIYVTSSGIEKKVKRLSQVPSRYRKIARCFSTQRSGYMAKPKDIKLQGTQRKEDMSSSLGRIELRWPRKVEALFGRTPRRAMADAARAAARALKHGGFPRETRNMDIKWQVVFMDEDLPETQIPRYLIDNCHPGWMTPPANIYIVAQRVAAGCSGKKPVKSSVADSELAEVLVHEIGHAVEYHLLQGRGGRDRMRSEGFATWFEQYASEFSSVISGSSVRREHLKRAKKAVAASPDYFLFQGSGGDYARASMYFHAVVEKGGIVGLMNVYSLMRNQGLDFFSAIRKKMTWSRERLEDEVRALVKKG